MLEDDGGKSPVVLQFVCGSIAAYKGADVCSKLVQAGYEVTVAMSDAATKLVGPLTFAALTGRPVATNLFRQTDAVHVEHIHLADRADLVVVCPATANFLAKAAHGIADDLLSSTLLATCAPVLICPAMNVNMWQHPAVERNLQACRDLGYRFVEPESGYLACGWVGEGRLAPTEQITAAVARILAEAN